MDWTYPSKVTPVAWTYLKNCSCRGRCPHLPHRGGWYGLQITEALKRSLPATGHLYFRNERYIGYPDYPGWDCEGNERMVASQTDQLRQAVTALERSYDSSLDFMGEALALKDAETGRHSKRVAAFTISIARAMELSADQIRLIARGGFLHDIGMLAVPDAILLKPSALTADETALLRQHCLTGYEILKKAPFLAEAAEIVYAHHERHDGSGYPRGLKSGEIPLGAKIVAVADALDTITSDQPYRSAQSITAARQEIRRSSGTQFDPAIVETFLGMPEHIWGDLRREVERQN